MAWSNLSEDLGELFGAFTSRADEMLERLNVRLEARRAYQREWERTQRKMTAARREGRRRRALERYYRLRPPNVRPYHRKPVTG